VARLAAETAQDVAGPPMNLRGYLCLRAAAGHVSRNITEIADGVIGALPSQVPGKRQFLQAVSFVHSDTTCPGMQQLLHTFGFLNTLASGRSRAICPYLYNYIFLLFFLCYFFHNSNQLRIRKHTNRLPHLLAIKCFFYQTL
jgi:hypothetical protein